MKYPQQNLTTSIKDIKQYNPEFRHILKNYLIKEKLGHNNKIVIPQPKRATNAIRVNIEHFDESTDYSREAFQKSV